jgi:hypothetical protein
MARPAAGARAKVSRGEELEIVALACEAMSREYSCAAGAIEAGTDHTKAPAAALRPCVMFSSTTPPFMRDRLMVEAVRVPVQVQRMSREDPKKTTVPRTLGAVSVTVLGGTKGRMVITGEIEAVLASEVEMTATVYVAGAARVKGILHSSVEGETGVEALMVARTRALPSGGRSSIITDVPPIK